MLRDFELGDKVEHPGAMSLPLGLAVALLKDPDGRIDLDVPVRGDVNDPEFKYGAVVAKALFNLITKIVTVIPGWSRVRKASRRRSRRSVSSSKVRICSFEWNSGCSASIFGLLSTTCPAPGTSTFQTTFSVSDQVSG